jgi:hypothetical protein
MDTVFTHNGGYDMILLVDGNVVVSAWSVTKQNLTAYLSDTDAQNWHTQYLEDRIEDYGLEVGRNGTLSPERHAFYFRDGYQQDAARRAQEAQ